LPNRLQQLDDMGQNSPADMLMLVTVELVS
jgi:hypothetical protein